MNKAFTIGAVSGISALALAFPVIAQIAGAQSSNNASSPSSMYGRMTGFHGERAPLSQEDVRDMIERDNAFLLNVDAFVSVQKAAIQNHRIALEAAADITDEVMRNDAVQSAHAAMRAEIEAAVANNPALKDSMRPLGGHGDRGEHGRMHGRGPNPEQLATKLGMTATELRSALEDGKTIKEIAEEKGFELPERKNMRGRRNDDKDEDDIVQR